MKRGEPMDAKPKTAPIRYLDTIEPVEVAWLAKPWFPAGKFVLLIGDPGIGKSTIAVSIAAALTTGGRIFGAENGGAVSNLIYQSAEDNVADTLKPRLMAAGADCSKVAVIEAGIDISTDIEIIDNAIRETGAKLLILDPLIAYIGKDADLSRAVDMRRLLGGLTVIAEKNSCTLLAVSHMNKASGAKNLYRGLGSIDIAASARSVLLIERSESDPDIRVIKHIKSSLAAEAKPLAFRIDDNSVVTFLGEYENETSGGESDSLMADGKREYAADILLRLLSEGARSSAEIQKVCADAGISERTLNRAKRDLGVSSVRKSDVWYRTLTPLEPGGKFANLDHPVARLNFGKVAAVNGFKYTNK